MKLSRLILCACIVIHFACNTDKKASSVLNTDALTVQTFGININRDTTLVTKGNCIIKIPAGSIQSDQADLKLEVKEALSNEDIVLAGLTTMSGDTMLSSGGMLKVAPAAGYKAVITKNITALVPAKDYNPDMHV